MEKIPTVFERDWDGDRSRVTEQVHEGCEWVLAGEGVATRKFDGTCVMFDGDKWWSRREVKTGKMPPSGFVASETDGATGKIIGWEPIGQSSFFKFFEEARENIDFASGTYELCGPKVQGNPEGFEDHVLVEHATATPYIVERTFRGMRDLLAHIDVEGFVFHHEDGRMAKIKGKDFGLRRP